MKELDGLDVKRGHIHSTWAGTFKCRPEIYIQPSNVNEINAIVRNARKYGKTIMLTGSGHSPSILTMTKDWLVNLDKFNKVIAKVEHKSGKWTDVTVEAGMRLYELNEYLKANELAIQNLGSISEQSVAGLISTGTHGSSAYHGLISEQVVNFTIMTADGGMILCSPNENQQLFKAGLISLGKLGIITHVTIRTIPRFAIESNTEVVSFDKFVDELWDTVWTSAEFTRVWWFPYSKHVVLWRADKAKYNEPITPPRKTFYDTFFGRLFYESLLWVAVHIAPSITPFVERYVFDKQFGMKDTLGNGYKRVDDSVDGLNMDCLFSQYVNEWGLPLNNGQKVLRQLEYAIDKAAEENRFYVHVPFEVRISNTTVKETTQEIDPDTIEIGQSGTVKGTVRGNELRPLLDPTPNLPYCSNRDEVTNDNLTLYLNATMYRPFGWSSSIELWYSEFEHVVSEAGGKPHWAKNFLGPINNKNVKTEDGDGKMRGLKPQTDEWYGDNIKKWREIRRQYDPNGMFLGTNDWPVINGLV